MANLNTPELALYYVLLTSVVPLPSTVTRVGGSRATRIKLFFSLGQLLLLIAVSACTVRSVVLG